MAAAAQKNQTHNSEIESLVATLASRQQGPGKTKTLSGPERAAVLMLALGTAWYLRANRMEPAAAGVAGSGTALPVGRKRGRHTR